MSSKLQAAIARMQRAVPLTGGAVLVGLSGGKDSLVTLDLCTRVFPRVEAFYMYHVAGLDCVERHVESAAKRARVKLHKVPHPELSRLIKLSILRPHTVGCEDVKLIKQKDIEEALARDTGITWCAYGERASDSFARRLYTRKNDGIHEGWKRVWPIWDWLQADVYAYLKARRIPLPERMGAADNKHMTGFSLKPKTLAWMKEHAPSDYAKVLRVFPYAEVQVIRYANEQAKAAARAAEKAAAGGSESKPKPRRGRRAGGAVRVSEVHDDAGAPLATAERALQPAHD